MSTKIYDFSKPKDIEEQVNIENSEESKTEDFCRKVVHNFRDGKEIRRNAVVLCGYSSK